MESNLVTRVQQTGEHHAFEQLMKQNQSPVRQFLRRLLQNDFAIADEIAQETFLKAFLQIKTYRGEGKFLSWLFKIAYQLFVNHTRKKKALTNVEIEDVADSLNAENQFDAQRTVQVLIKYLKPDERATLLLHFSHELSHQEIAVVMDIPLGTVKTLIRRSRLKLKSLAEQNEIGESHEA
jgi:RNA polymerase sigma-70 factor (ECF subfamily)